MKKYSITYQDATDLGCPAFTCVVRAHSYQHAIERFFESDDTGWLVLRIAMHQENVPSHAWAWRDARSV